MTMNGEISSGRRAFLGRMVGRATDTVLREATRRAIGDVRWIRPPFALPELDFVLACTRCGECIAACPHGTVFSLSVGLGAILAGTPALDLNNRACYLCADWPCVNACQQGALSLPYAEAWPAPLAEATIDTAQCLPYQGPECGACESSCPVAGALRWEHTRPHIDPTLCLGCGRCRSACIVSGQDESGGAIRMRPVPQSDDAQRAAVARLEEVRDG